MLQQICRQTLRLTHTRSKPSMSPMALPLSWEFYGLHTNQVKRLIQDHPEPQWHTLDRLLTTAFPTFHEPCERYYAREGPRLMDSVARRVLKRLDMGLLAWMLGMLGMLGMAEQTIPKGPKGEPDDQHKA
jgi:hypothetical protein